MTARVEMQRTLEGACKSALHIAVSPSPMIVFRSDVLVTMWHFYSIPILTYQEDVIGHASKNVQSGLGNFMNPSARNAWLERVRARAQ